MNQPTNQLKLEDVIEKIKSFDSKLKNVAQICNNPNQAVVPPYLAIALADLLNDPSSKELGSLWFAMVIKAIIFETELPINTLEELDKFEDMFYDLFDKHNVKLSEETEQYIHDAFWHVEIDLNLSED
ncbi:hypothetical protein [Proteus mirabilis]|uniref:hypothetical protein n=1 Tax=Proteus mirabilis TaxID=584 RepID=UPI0015F1C668|nr:hypothetical protein [Proteus phage 10]